MMSRRYLVFKSIRRVKNFAQRLLALRRFVTACTTPKMHCNAVRGNGELLRTKRSYTKANGKQQPWTTTPFASRLPKKEGDLVPAVRYRSTVLEVQYFPGRESLHKGTAVIPGLCIVSKILFLQRGFLYQSVVSFPSGERSPSELQIHGDAG